MAMAPVLTADQITRSAKRALKLTLFPTLIAHTAPTLSTGSHTLSDGVTLK